MPRQSRKRADAPAGWSTDDWATPPAYVAQLAREFRVGRFTLDPCATDATAKADTYYTIEENGLEQPWDGAVFVNPPYSDPAPWVRKALVEAPRCEIIVMLLPNATDTEWFHDLVLAQMAVRLVRGRIRFHGWMGAPIGSPRAGNVIASLPVFRDPLAHLVG